MALFPILDAEGKQTETFDLPDTIFRLDVRGDIIHQAVVMYLANRRQGTASTKERGAVSGGGKKPYRQKGTGRARAGSIRSPLWHGGGVVFGPHPRDFGYSIPQKVRKAALRESLNAKYISNDLLCIDQLKAPSNKTKDFVKVLDRLHLKGKGKILAIWSKEDAQNDSAFSLVLKVSRNIPHFSLMRSQDVNAYDILRNKKVLMTKAAFKNLLERIQ